MHIHHHPEEIKATLAALKETFPKEKTIAIFQPHRYTRFREFFHDFKNAFSDADEVIITDIYGAGEAAMDLDVTSLGFEYIPYNELVDNLKGRPGIKVTLGAGDITQVAERLGCAMSS